MSNQETLMHQFDQLLKDYNKRATQIVTKEEKAKQEENQQLVEVVADYTPNSIVKGLADLQLKFGSAIENLTEELKEELTKINQLRSAITVQGDKHGETMATKVAANALYILKKENEFKLQEFEKKTTEKLETFEKEVAEDKATWEKDAARFEQTKIDYTATITKERQQAEEQHSYNLAIKNKVAEDDYSLRKKLLVRRLEEEQATKEKNWAIREKILNTQEADLEKFKTAVDNFEEELKAKANEARDKAMKKASRDAKEAAQLFEKEIEGQAKIDLLTIENHETNIVEQKAQIEQLNLELKEALEQVQTLSIKALEAGKFSAN